MEAESLRPKTSEMIRIYILDHLGCGLHNSDAALQISAWTQIGGTPAGHQAMNLPETTRKKSLCVGV